MQNWNLADQIPALENAGLGNAGPLTTCCTRNPQQIDEMGVWALALLISDVVASRGGFSWRRGAVVVDCWNWFQLSASSAEHASDAQMTMTSCDDVHGSWLLPSLSSSSSRREAAAGYFTAARLMWHLGARLPLSSTSRHHRRPVIIHSFVIIIAISQPVSLSLSRRGISVLIRLRPAASSPGHIFTAAVSRFQLLRPFLYLSASIARRA